MRGHEYNYTYTLRCLVMKQQNNILIFFYTFHNIWCTYVINYVSYKKVKVISVVIIIMIHTYNVFYLHVNKCLSKSKYISN